MTGAVDPGIIAFYGAIVIVIAGVAELGNWIGRRNRRAGGRSTDIATLTAATLGLLALLLAFSFSIALSRFDARREVVLEEANAIGSAANFAQMLPPPAQPAVLALLREYAAVRIKLGSAADAAALDAAIAASLDLQQRLWRHGVAAAAAAPQALSISRFVNSLNEINNIHEKRVTALRYHVPSAVMTMLIGVALVAMGFTGYNSGVVGARRRAPDLIMAVTIGLLIMLVVDLDEPHRGLIHVPGQPLLDVSQSLAAAP